MANNTKQSQFKRLYDLHWHHVFAYVYNIISDQAQAEDIVQEIFIDVWNRFDHLDLKTPKAYLLQAARYQCAKHFKKNKFTHVQLDTVMDILNHYNIDLTREKTEELVSEIANKADVLLPAKCKQVFELRFYHQYNNREIAEELGLSVSTVENQLNKALKLLRFSVNQQASVVLVATTVGVALV
ncbi:RNA polymerase sigma factor [Fulvivirga ligni]|uniref:RNA polymerase sigma factor n=1 Tax=Fulvivirga ligni TaxID=2904246 RepID=UPI001F1AA8B9|nr:sigma-70 family RNA polymerase sigma factor [Fulvivirga ligni]UII24030.1 sigma-70 family RNA polymerase sigma factor [Fulvivirga ligni]